MQVEYKRQFRQGSKTSETALIAAIKLREVTGYGKEEIASRFYIN
jgi:hypothetical protein